MKILFVCLGNICRSPIAEGVMKQLIVEHDLNWVVDSAGTESYHIGEGPHPYSREVCAEYQIDISSQKARQFSVSDIDNFDRVYALSVDVYGEIRKIAGNKMNEKKVLLFLHDSLNKAHCSVKDPWYGGKEGYYEVFDVIKNGCEAIIKKYTSRQ